MSELLTQGEIEALTGYSRTKEQSAWLQKEKILHFVNGQNRVVVTWQSVNNPRLTITTEPDFSCLETAKTRA